jgi:hypothetical protein
MVRNAKQYGILTTVNSWVFLRRENNGKLYMTQPIDCQMTSPSFTILQALYYISALAFNDGHLVETDEIGNPVHIELANSKYPSSTAPSVTGSPNPPSSTTDAFIIYPSQSSQYYTLINQSLGHSLLLEPWKSESCCGGKSFRGILMPNHESVVVKLWDGYKSPPDMRDREVEIYMKLRDLWGKYTAQLICSADIDFCFGIILDEIKVPHNNISIIYI